MDCPIHLSRIAFDAEGAAALRCGHVFCLPCITKWLDSKPRGKCPVCNKPARRGDVLQLYGRPSSPSSSPIKNETLGRHSAAVKNRARRLLQDLEGLDLEGIAEAEMTCMDMDDAVSATSTDSEAKRLAEEINSAVSRFQSRLSELEGLRIQLEVLKQEKAHLCLSLQQKTQEVDETNRQKNILMQNVANLRMAKNIADDSCSTLRRTLQVTEGKLVDAEGTVRAKDEIIGGKEEQLIEYRRWLAQNQGKLQMLKAKVKELENRLDDQLSRDKSASRWLQEEPQAVAPSVQESSNGEPEDDGEYDVEPSMKRRRTDNEENLRDVKLDKSCFIRKTKASFQIPRKEPEGRKAGPVIPGLHIVNGQVKGVVTVGSRRRMEKIR